MKFKIIFTIGVTALICFVVFNFFSQRKIRSIEQELRGHVVEQIKEVENRYNEEIGEYSVYVARVSDNLLRERSLTRELRNTIQILEKELASKALRITEMSVTTDSLKVTGIATVIVDTLREEKTYVIHEKVTGGLFYFKLNHPSGEYNYSFVYDPIKIQLFSGKTRQHDIYVESVLFPGSPHIKVSSFEVVFVEDPRSWTQRIWDNVSLQFGVVTGKTQGLSVSLGYDKVAISPFYTNAGSGMALWYKVK